MVNRLQTETVPAEGVTERKPNIVVQFVQGLKTCLVSSAFQIKKHPWWATVGLSGSVASTLYVCHYCGIIAITGMIIYSIKQERSALGGMACPIASAVDSDDDDDDESLDAMLKKYDNL